MINLSFSIINQLNSICPAKWNALWMEKSIPFPPSDSNQNLGKYFEYLIIGKSSRDDDQVIDLPRLRNGEKSVAQIRIEEQAQYCSDLLNPNHDLYKGYNVKNVQKKMSFDIPELDVHFESTADIEASDFYDDPVLIDLKLTQDVTSTRHPKSWGHDVDELDLDQSVLYAYNFYKNYNKIPKFEYWIFDYTTSKNRKKIVIPAQDSCKIEGYSIISKAVSKIKDYQKHNFNIKIPSTDDCKTCPLMCSERACEYIEQKIS
jgi:hypothetical protein